LRWRGWSASSAATNVPCCALRLARGGHPIALVPVAAILVASLRLHAPDLTPAR
jgi:hypothetical protein